MKNKLLTMLLSLVISFSLWLYVVTVISPESEATYYNVPVELVGSDYLNAQNLLLVSDTNLRMNLTLRGNRTDLNKLNDSNITILADLSKITSAGEHELKYTISYPGIGTVEVLKKEPEQFFVTVAEQLSKTIEVEVNFVGDVAGGYEADKSSVSLDHTTVTVRGPREVVEGISHAGINVDLTGKMSTFVGDYPLILYNADFRPVSVDKYLVSNVETVRTIVQVNKLKTIPLTFDIDDEDSGMLADMVTASPMIQEITVLGSDTALEQLTELNLGSIMLRDLASNAILSFPVNLPAGVVCKDDIDAVLVEVQIPEMAELEIQVTRFDMLNLSEGIEVQVTGAPVIKLWGPKEKLNELTDHTVLGLIDCENLVEGATLAPIRFLVEGYEYLRISGELNAVAIQVTATAESSE